MTDEQQIRTLIERWATAVHAGDLDTVAADHAPDILMFDVPPPDGGVRGIEASRDTWPGFFAWQASGGSFEITSIGVTAGTDVASASVLLRCDTAEALAARPTRRLRLTLGLTKVDDRWVVNHEHHSFPLDDADPTTETGQVEAMHQHWFDRTTAKDVEGLMQHIADDVISYEHNALLAYVGVDAVREVCQRGLDASAGAVTWDVPEMTIRTSAGLAVAWGFNLMTSETADGQTVEVWSRWDPGVRAAW